MATVLNTPAPIAASTRTGRWTVLITGAVLVALAVAGHVRGTGEVTAPLIGLTAPIAVAYTTMGALVLAGVPGHPVGRLTLTAGGLAAVVTLAASWSQWVVAAWLSQWLWWPPIGLIFLVLLFFPDGRLPSRRWRPLAVVIASAGVVGSVTLALAALDHPRDLLTEVIVMTPRAHLLVRIGGAAIALAALGLLAVLGSLVVRWRRAGGEARSQLSCLVVAGALLVVGLALNVPDVPGSSAVIALSLPLAMTVAVLQHRLYGLDQVVHRGIVWLLMTVLVVGGFVVIVAGLGGEVTGGDTSIASLVATGLIAVTFEPLRRRVQRHVDRLVYGDRDDPYEVIARLGGLLGWTGEPNALLPLLTGSIAGSLRVPYVAVEIDGRAGPRLLAEHGSAGTPIEAFDMVAHGDRVGRLLVATRSRGARFTRRERRLLHDAALHAGVAVEATRRIRDLQDSREHLVLAREEERRRLRRDLHDGLGPAIAGMSMQVRAAQKLLTDPDRAAERLLDRAGGILGTLATDLRTCTVELRQLVDQLRPAALDRGLADALRAECRRFNTTDLTVRLQIEQPLDGLPAAVEVAAYRIVAESLTNVARHARAGACEVTVHRGRSLRIDIVDDGVGPSGSSRSGVGLDSMRERVAELGGDYEIGPVEPRGTAVRVGLALPAEPVS
ncbi:sensor histidine kinase [Actinoplanes sp. CA-252034]|uniref:sensor histidine kinase n=1 Tax=Actinoplanes sp. CA-252034 TaxID=3239906 RepID=UPI003D966B1A